MQIKEKSAYNYLINALQLLTHFYEPQCVVIYYENVHYLVFFSPFSSFYQILFYNELLFCNFAFSIKHWIQLNLFLIWKMRFVSITWRKLNFVTESKRIKYLNGDQRTSFIIVITNYAFCSILIVLLSMKFAQKNDE